MKRNALIQKTLKGAVYAVLALPLFQMSPTVLSSDRSNWAQDYVGELKFDLNDDSRLKDLNQNTRFARERLDEVIKSLGEKTQDLGKLRNELKVTTAQIDKLSHDTVAAVSEKNKTKIKRKISNQNEARLAIK